MLRKNESFWTRSSVIENLTLLQHYGIPTRLLDITSNILITFYFACESQFDKVGEVIIFEEFENKIKYIDSKSVGIASMLSQIHKKSFTANPIGKTEIDVEAKESLLFNVRKEYGHFEDRLGDFDYDQVIFLKSRYNGDPRITNQAGHFIVGVNHENFEEKILSKINNPCYRFLIMPYDKKNIIKSLDILNVNTETVLTTLMDTSKYLKDKFLSK